MEVNTARLYSLSFTPEFGSHKRLSFGAIVREHFGEAERRSPGHVLAATNKTSVQGHIICLSSSGYSPWLSLKVTCQSGRIHPKQKVCNSTTVCTVLLAETLSQSPLEVILGGTRHTGETHQQHTHIIVST